MPLSPWLQSGVEVSLHYRVVETQEVPGVDPKYTVGAPWAGPEEPPAFLLWSPECIKVPVSVSLPGRIFFPFGGWDQGIAG